MPEIDRRYRCTPERVLVGESLAGLFVIETILTRPEPFSRYVAVDPSLWWDRGWLVEHAAELVAARPINAQVVIAHSNEPKLAESARRLGEIFTAKDLPSRVAPFPSETHGTVLHPALLTIFRELLGP